jgi:hypothetical protein
VPVEVAKWLATTLTTEEVATLSVPSPTPEATVAKTIAADALIRAADAIRPAVA